MDFERVEIRIKAKACAAIVANIKAFLQVDYSDELEYEEALTRLEAVSLMFTDILDQIYGQVEATEVEVQAKANNPFYSPITVSPKPTG